MNKIWYKIKFRQKTPIHIGTLNNYGVLSETRLFIPGCTMWGALVNKYGKMNGGNDEDYERGKNLFESITCFFPKIEGSGLLFPCYIKGKYSFGSYSEEMLRLVLTDVYVSTSIKPETLSAKDESLHETEILLPKLKGKEPRQVYWEGLLAIDRQMVEEVLGFFKEDLEIVVGGDTRYGFGNLTLDSPPEKATEEDLNMWNIRDRKPDFEREIRNYAALVNGISSFEGEVERVITNFDFSRATPVVKEKHSLLVVKPGGKLKVRVENVILSKGIYHIYIK